MAHFLDVSIRYFSGFVEGHYASFHESLAQAARRAGHRFTVAARADRATEDDELVSVRLASKHWYAIVDQLRHELSDAAPRIVMVYEGDLQCLEAFKQLARDVPQHVFVINLFRPEHLLNMPSDVARERTPANSSLAELAYEMPSNVRVLAETDRRARIARHLGLDVLGTWPWHSSVVGLSDAGEAGRTAETLALIAVNNWQIEHHHSTLKDLYAVLRRARRWAPGIQFELLGSVNLSRRRWAPRRGVLRRLPGSSTGPVPMIEYARRLASAGIVWLPTQDLYTGMSSGKVLDALVLGKPLLVPSGTFGQLQQDRWIPGALSYRTVPELLDILDHLPSLIAGWTADLHAQRTVIRDEYSADRAIARLHDIATGAG